MTLDARLRGHDDELYTRSQARCLEQPKAGEGLAPMLEQFAARAIEVGVRVHGPVIRVEAAAKVAELCRSAGAHRVLLSPDLQELREPVAEAVTGVGARLIEGTTPREAAAADLGVSRAALAVAETGSVVVAGNELLPRLATMLPLVHVVLVYRQDMVSSLEEVGEFLRGSILGDRGEAVRYHSLVTGPSRTADIEKTLSTGVHGPRELHIVLVE